MQSKYFRAGVLCTLLAILVSQSGIGATTAAPLSFFKNYFVTGDYTVGGASLWRKGVNGVATRRRADAGVPATADILAAFLYIQTAEKTQWSGIDHAKFNGNDLGAGSASLAKALNWDAATVPCWSVPARRPPAGDLSRRRAAVPADRRQRQARASNRSHIVQVPDCGAIYGDDDEGGTENGSWTARAPSAPAW